MILKDGADYEPSETELAVLHAAYPGLNIAAELAKMRAWCLANPAKRKTARGALRFINQWLTRSDAQTNNIRTVHALVASAFKPVPPPTRTDRGALPVQPQRPQQTVVLTTPENRARLAAEIARLRARS